MAVFEIYENNRENSSVTIYIKNKHDMYDFLVNNYDIDEETAIDIDSWSELASINETYETDTLTIGCNGVKR